MAPKVKFIGIKEFRNNLAKYTNLANKLNITYIILRKNKPVLEVSPANEKRIAIEKLKTELDEIEKDMDKGNYFTQEEIMQEFGLL